MTKPKILCTGAPRSGTSLFNLLMSHFLDLKVHTEGGTPDKLFYECDVFTTQQRPDGKLWNDILGNTPLSFVDILKRGIKVIAIYRDGRDCFVSARKLRPKELQDRFDKGDPQAYSQNYHSVKTETSYWYSLEETEKWINSINETFKTLEEVKGTELEQNYLVVKYEDLVHNPEIEMKKVENFVGYPLDPSYINFYEKANYRRMISSPNIMGEGNQIAIREDSAYEGAVGSEFENHRPIAPDSIGRWEKSIHKERIKEILTKYKKPLTNTLIKLGYETNKKWTNEFK